MDRWFLRLIISGVILLVCSGPLMAQTAYVSSVTEITMRTEPGLENRIVEILKSGTPLTIVEYRKDWSMVESDSGKQGWILTRFITEERPKSLIVDELMEKNKTLSQDLEDLKTKNKELSEANANLLDIEKKYLELKQDSVGVLDLQEKYDQINQKYTLQVQQVKALETRLRNDDNIFFLCGAGVFIFGLILGVSTRKKRRSSLL